MERRTGIRVCCLQAVDSTVGGRLDARLDGITVDVHTDQAALAADDTVDCFVLVGEEAVDVLAGTTTETTPVIAVIEPGDGACQRALDAGATDVVTNAGPDAVTVLANRIERAVDHRRTVDDLQAARARFDALAENDGFAVVTIDERSVIRYASPALEDVFGYDPERLVGESLTVLMPERFREQHHETLEHYLETGERTLDWDRVELPGQRKDGTEVPLRFSFSEGTTGDSRRFSAVVQDISDERAREERLDKLASAVEGSMDGVALLDAEGCYQYCNDAHREIYGCDDTEALLGEYWGRFYDEEEVERFEQEILPTVRDEGRWRGEAVGQRASGESFPQELTLTALDNGGLICVVRDITDRVDQRKRLRRERQFVETLIDTLPDVFYVVDTDGRFSRWNDRFESVTGYTGSELDGMEALQVIAPDDRDAAGEAIARVLGTGDTESIRARLLTKQGDRITYEFSGSRITDADGATVGLAGIGRDVSDRELRRQRLTVLSRVLRHDVRNRTTVIQGQARHVRDRVSEGTLEAALDRVESAAAELATTSERARQAEQILREGAQRRPVDLAALVDEALATVDTGGMTVERDCLAGTTVFGTDAIEDALGELLRNVRSHVDDPTIRISAEVDAESVALVVADDGPGIPPHERRALLDGDESPLSHSTGLGLWLVRWIVTAAGGQITIRDSDLGGSAVVLSFPLA
mgnify:CR=1 FL=1